MEGSNGSSMPSTQSAMTKAEFKPIIFGLWAAIGREPLAEAGFLVWYECLKDIDPKVLQLAVYRWLCEQQKGADFPSIGTLRRFAAEAVHGTLPAAADVYGRVRAVMRKFSPHYQPVEFMDALDPETRQAVNACGGVGRLADLLADDVGTYLAQLRNAYQSIAERTELDRRLPAPLRRDGLPVTLERIGIGGEFLRTA